MESKKRKFLFGLLCGALAVLLVLTMVYSYLIVTPTGLEKVAKPMVAARARVALNAVARGNDPAGSAEKLPPAERPKIRWVLNLPASLSNFATFSYGSAPQFFYSLYLANRELQPEAYPCEHPPAAGGSLWAALDANQQIRLTHAAQYFLERRQSRVTISDSDAVAIANELDQLEAFLITSARAMPSASDGWYINLGHAFYIKVMMSIERACVRGEKKKALALLDGFLDTLRMLQYAYVHDGCIQSSTNPEAQKVFWRGLALVPGLPAEWREHARGALGNMAAYNVQPPEAWPYTASMWRERALSRLDQDHNANQNFWHFFSTGERIVNRALRPIANHEIDSMCAALGRGDMAQFRAERRSLAGTLGMMNMSMNVISRDELDMLNSFNGRAAETAANARACLDLINEHEDRATTETIAVERFGRFENATFDFYAALQHDSRKNIRTPAEIDAFIKKNNREDWRQYVKWYGPTTMKISWVLRGKEVVVTFPPEDAQFEKELRVLLMRRGSKQVE